MRWTYSSRSTPYLLLINLVRELLLSDLSDLKLHPMKSASGSAGMLTPFFVMIFKTLKPPNRRGLNMMWASVWMALVWLVWFIFRLDPDQIVSQPVLKWNTTQHAKSLARNGAAPSVQSIAADIVKDGGGVGRDDETSPLLDADERDE